MQELILLGSKDRASVDVELEHWGPSLEWALLRTCDLFPISAPDILLKNDQSQ